MSVAASVSRAHGAVQPDRRPGKASGLGKTGPRMSGEPPIRCTLDTEHQRSLIYDTDPRVVSAYGKLMSNNRSSGWNTSHIPNPVKHNPADSRGNRET
jgi:hypothetical protein